MANKPESIARIKNYYLNGVLAIYIIAFASLYFQVRSLFGDEGVVPLKDFISKQKNPESLLISLAPKLELDYGVFVEILCLVGIFIALASLLIRRLANALSFALLWYLYYSICIAGQGFMSFHSDLMLLEVGFITILLAPLLPTPRINQSDHDHLTFFLLKWLTFRYFVTNVLNVYLDNDKSWYSMTAIPMVAQGVQFPSIFSWHIYHLPLEYVKMYQAYEHTVKLCTPFLFLLDLKYSRLLAFYSLLFVQISSALFFNFGWTDLLIAVCLLSYLKDAYFYNDKRAQQSGARTFFDLIMVSAYIGLVSFILVRFYGFKYEPGTIKSQVMFTPAQFKLLVDHLTPISLVFGFLGLLSSGYTTYFNSSKKTSIIKTFVYTSVVVALFFSTFPTMLRFTPGLEVKFKPVAVTKDLSRFVAPYMLSNNYILLSKVSQHYADGRTELQVQARTSPEDPIWQKLEPRFKSKNLSHIVPHLPRIELRLWYAARSSMQNNLWLKKYASVEARKLCSKKSHVQVRIVSNTLKYAAKPAYWEDSKTNTEYMPTDTVACKNT